MVRFNPAHAKGWCHLGVLCRNEHGREEAIRAFREVARLKPELAEVWYRLGLLLSENGENEEARISFREAVRLKPDYLHAWCGLGMTCAALGDEAELAHVEQQLSLFDPRVAAHFREGCVQAAVSALPASSPGARRQRARSRRLRERELIANFEAWLKSLPAPSSGNP